MYAKPGFKLKNSEDIQILQDVVKRLSKRKHDSYQLSPIKE